MQETVTKERPILFSGPMVRAILEGRKTQTRWVVKWSREDNPGYWPFMKDGAPVLVVDGNPQNNRPLPCPYGEPGDRLWVRETWALVRADEDGIDDWIDMGPVPDSLPWPGWQVWCRAGHSWAYDHPDDRGFRWRPSIHMPRWASRITLEVTGVRVERVQDISEDDAKAEGVTRGMIPVTVGPAFVETHREAFAQLWDKINSKRPGCSWADNPWVWVVEFRRHDA